MKKSHSDFDKFLLHLSEDLFTYKDSFELAKVFAVNVLHFMKFESAQLIWPDLTSQKARPVKVQFIGKKEITGLSKLYSTRFRDQDDVFFRIEFLGTKKQKLTGKQKDQILMAEHLTKKAILANEARLQKEEMDRFMWMRHLSAGISHELNTPLTTLLFYVNKLGKDHAESPMFREIKKSIGTIENVLAHYKVMSGDGQFTTFENLDVRELCGRISDRAQHTFSDKFHLMKFEVVNPEGMVSVRAHDIENLFVILLKNSLEALVQGKASTDEHGIKVVFKCRQGNLRITVTDEGHGIKAENRSYIFSPNFSTKDVDQGSGLGLSLARAIAFLNEGTLRLNPLSEKTQFILELPLAKNDVTLKRKAV